MGDVNLTINYWVIAIFFMLFLRLYFYKRNLFSLINLLTYVFYSTLYICQSENKLFSLFQMILLHLVISTFHLLFTLIVQVIIKRKVC